MLVEDQDPAYASDNWNFRNGSCPLAPFYVDIFAFGVILLELLGKMVQNNGYDLARWIQLVVQKEWTLEVFDQVLTSEGTSKERMVKLLQVVLKCISPSAMERPSMSHLASTVNKIKAEEEEEENEEEEERSQSSSEA